VIADSRSTCEDLVALLGIDRRRIDVVPLGLGAVRRAEPLSERQTRAAFELGERRLLLSLSAKRPHKNLRALIDALAEIDAPQRPVLVLPGYPTEHERELREHVAALALDADVRFPAWVSAEQLEGLWQLASGFVFPSLYEGFGLPVLEAMARGVPVACSNTSSLPEVAGGAALLFDPRSVKEISRAIVALVSDPALRERLRELGHERARRFSWERSARLTLDSYARALGPAASLVAADVEPLESAPAEPDSGLAASGDA
jgi:glycosyltransferase involved in cell wall biosynthesis